MCARAKGKEDLGERRMEKEEKRHITQMRETDEARRGPPLPSPPALPLLRRRFSYILAATPKRANTVSFRSLAIALSRASILVLSLFFIFAKLSRNIQSLRSLTREKREILPHPRFSNERPRRRREEERSFSLHTAESRETEKGRPRAARLDRKGRHKLLDIPRRRSLLPAYRAASFRNMRPPKIVATHTGYETFTCSPPSSPPSSPFIVRGRGVRVPLKALKPLLR